MNLTTVSNVVIITAIANVAITINNNGKQTITTEYRTHSTGKVPVRIIVQGELGVSALIQRAGIKTV